MTRSLLLLLVPALASAQPAPAPAPTPAPAPPDAEPSLENPPDLAPAPKPPPAPEAPPLPPDATFSPGAYLQPQFRLRQNSPYVPSSDGFRFARARLFGRAATKLGGLEVSGYVEGEMQPQFSLFFAFATLAYPLPAAGRITVDLGQMQVPVTHENLISDSNLAFVEKSQLMSIAPDHDLGTRLWIVPPAMPWLRVIGSAFNGEGKDMMQNGNESLLYTGRVEITPLGSDPFRESYFNGDWVVIAASIAHNKLSPPGSHHELLTYIGADADFAWHGLSGAFEYLEVHHDYDGDITTAPPRYHANGYYAQLLYMPPIELVPGRLGRLEVGARIEELDRNDTVPIAVPGAPNQSFRELTACVSYYLRGHYLKAQLAASHFTQIEKTTADGTNATFPEDQILLQLTYRMENLLSR